jgi:DNA replication and repair protein RecF
MRLKSLHASNFRNLESVQIDTDARFVVFHGPNAQGKTNLLEAIYGLATLKSFRARRNTELVRWGTDRAEVRGQVDDGTLTRDFRLQVDSKGRRGEVDGKPPQQLARYFEGIRAVLFRPEDTEIVREGPEVRRRFIDRAAFTASATFLELAMSFRRLLSQKAALLRQPPVDPISLAVFDEQLSYAGARLVERRLRIVEELRLPFTELHGRISGHGTARLKYRTQLDPERLQESYLELLERSRADEIRRGMNLVGPQRDDLVLKLDDRPSRSYASQGQTRSIVLALKLAELLAARERGARPIFLLDDLSSELDRFRTGRLVELLEELELQVVVTTTDPTVLEGADDLRCFTVEGGAIAG